MMNREITFPQTFDMSPHKGSAQFGLVEYLLEHAFVRNEAFADQDAVDLGMAVVPQLRAHRGEAQVGWKLILSEAQWELLKQLARPGAAPISPAASFEVSTFLRVLYSAPQVAARAAEAAPK
jgi:hypothetical protein